MISKEKINRKLSPIRQFILEFTKLFKRANVVVLSKAFAYYLLISFFPLLIFIGNLFAFLRIDLNAIPKPTLSLLTDITKSIRYSLIILLLIGSFLVFVWAMSRVLNVLNQGINELYNPHWDQNFIIKRAMSLFYTFLLMAVVVIIAITIIFGEMIIKMIAPIFNISQKYLLFYA